MQNNIVFYQIQEWLDSLDWGWRLFQVQPVPVDPDMTAAPKIFPVTAKLGATMLNAAAE